MSQDEKAAPAATTSEVRHSKFYWLSSSVEEFELRQTLDAYEVEELDGHDLARFLPSILLSEESSDEIGGVSSAPIEPDLDSYLEPTRPMCRVFCAWRKGVWRKQTLFSVYGKYTDPHEKARNILREILPNRGANAV